MFFHTTPVEEATETDRDQAEPVVITRETDKIPAAISWMHALAKRGEATNYYPSGATIRVLGWDRDKYPVDLGDATVIVLRYKSKEEKG